MAPCRVCGGHTPGPCAPIHGLFMEDMPEQRTSPLVHDWGAARGHNKFKGINRRGIGRPGPPPPPLGAWSRTDPAPTRTAPAAAAPGPDCFYQHFGARRGTRRDGRGAARALGTLQGGSERSYCACRPPRASRRHRRVFVAA